MGFLRRLRSSPTGMTAFAGYVAMVSTMVVGFITVPLALSFLSAAEFGLWRVAGQSLGYLLLLDLGVSWSASRMLMEPLRSGDSGELDSWWTVIVGVLSVQALLVAGLGFAGTDWIIASFELPPDLVPAAHLLWTGMILINAIQLPFRAYSGILYCQNRWYVMHLVTIISSWLNLVVFVALLAAGFRTSAYLIASAVAIGSNVVLLWYSVRKSGQRLRLAPRLFDRDKLRILLRYSSGIFLLALAAQITFMSQAIIVNKMLGLEAVTVFAVSFTSFTVIAQLMRRAFDAYSPRWMQLFVEGNKQSVWTQWNHVMAWLLPATGIGAMGILVFNRSFSMWYGGPVNHVGRFFDLLLAVCLVMYVFMFASAFVFHLSARIKGWCIAGLADAVLQMATGILLTRWFGISGVLLGALIGPAMISIPFLILRAPREFGISRREMMTVLGRHCGAVLLIIALCYSLLSLPSAQSSGWWPTTTEFFLGGCLALVGGAWCYKFRGFFGGARRVEA